ncbi:ABC transporter permease [Galactobacter sp.]|uniref:ABC transporter permease n=1 Tax=Galactobacter sp. TaxID=2676125 RepID=UPI0025C736AD|nr:ABC transporter permease [Galactobacter sp.]
MTAAEYAAEHGLQRVGARPGPITYLKQTWARRDFAYTLAKSRIKARNQANRLGMLWEILKPTINALMYGFIFGILQGGRRGPDFPAYVVVGVFLFEFFSHSMANGAKSIIGNRALVQSLNFPRLTLPVSVIIQQLLTLAPMIVVMFIYVLILGQTPKWSWFYIVPIVGLLTLLSMGIAMICARLTVHFHDLTQLIPLVTRFFFFTSGVLFSVDNLFKSWPWLVTVYDFHPIYQVLEIARGAILDERTFDPMHWIGLSAWSVVLLIGGFFFFWQAEERYGRDN